MAQFKCSVCGDVFDNGDELAEHVKEAHGNEEVEDFECNICGERFETAPDLTAHMSAAHPNQ